MGALDPVKILAVLVIALIVLGPEKLPRVARQLGAAWHELTKFRDKVEQEVREAIPDLDLPRIPPRPGAAVAGFLADLTAPIKAGPSTPADPDAALPEVPPPADPVTVGEGSVPDGAEAGAPPAPAAASGGVLPLPAGARGATSARAPFAAGHAPVSIDDPSMN